MNLARILSLAFAVCIATAAGADEWFAPFQRVADYKPKGPTHCFRQFNIDWSWIALRPDQIPEFLSEADPAALAEFCRRMNMDGTVVMAVPHHGYCTYETRVGAKFPGMKGDWFGRTIEELHKRKIAAFGYVTLNWNWKYIRENLGRDFIHGKPDAEGVCASKCTICLNAPGYIELVEAYTREVLEKYPVDGMRWDILQTAGGCVCDGCKRFYRETYGEEWTGWDKTKPGRVHDFYLATTGRIVTRLHALCKRIKPSVEIWQNSIQSYHPNHLDLSRKMDIAYNEYGDPFRLLFIRGVANKPAAINGLMNKTPTEPPAPLDRREWRTCLALGGRCYSYYGHKQTSHKTLLPNETMQTWHREQLAPFYAMVRDIEPWLQDATPVSHVGIVFSEATRFRFPRYDRAPYIAAMEPIANAGLQRNAPVEFVNALDLGNPQKRLQRLKLLILPRTSGLSAAQLDPLRRYVRAGGNLLIAGDALRHDARGNELGEMALAKELGLRRGDAIPSSLHVRPYGRGKMACIAEATPEAIDLLAGPAPLSVQPPQSRVILTRQEKQRRWVLHLLDDGPCTVEIRREFADASKVERQFPPTGWTHDSEATTAGLRIRASGQAADRLLVLE